MDLKKLSRGLVEVPGSDGTKEVAGEIAMTDKDLGRESEPYPFRFKHSNIDFCVCLTYITAVNESTSESPCSGSRLQTRLQPRVLQQGVRVGGDGPVAGRGGRRTHRKVLGLNAPFIFKSNQLSANEKSVEKLHFEMKG